MGFFWLCAAVAVAVAVWLLPSLLRRRRRARALAQPFPARWRRIMRRRVPLVNRLPADLRQRLRQRVQVFMAEVPFLGCDGLEVTEAMRVVVATQACLLLMGRQQTAFPNLRQVLLYPAPFVVPRAEVDTAGVHSVDDEVRSGESWVQGQVVLSWPDCLDGAADPQDGQNVVLHEFAHQLDQEGGDANGAPPDRRAPRRWSRVFQAAYDATRIQRRHGMPGVIPAYGTHSPAEFFAVATEVFFERPEGLEQAFPALYEELAAYFGADPLNW